jgi:hypothetical protein
MWLVIENDWKRLSWTSRSLRKHVAKTIIIDHGFYMRVMIFNKMVHKRNALWNIQFRMLRGCQYSTLFEPDIICQYSGPKSWIIYEEEHPISTTAYADFDNANRKWKQILQNYCNRTLKSALVKRRRMNRNNENPSSRPFFSRAMLQKETAEKTK